MADDAKTKTQVGIVMGSDSDLPVMREAVQALMEFGIGSEMRILSAHRAPEETAEYARTARERGIRVIIAGAGAAAHLPGVIAAFTVLPVIGVPIATGSLQGQDALYSIVQMPKGVPVATMAIGGSWNAGVLAAQILGSGGANMDREILERLASYKDALRRKVLAKVAQ